METKTFVTLPYLLAGLNGKDGLIRQHFHAAAKVKEFLRVMALSQKPPNFKTLGKCRVVYSRYASRLMDWDNAAASAKHLLDALVKSGYIIDDSPQVITAFEVRQVKCKRAEEKTVIEIIA